VPLALIGLETEGAHVLEHQRRRAEPGVPRARRGQLLPAPGRPAPGPGTTDAPQRPRTRARTRLECCGSRGEHRQVALEAHMIEPTSKLWDALESPSEAATAHLSPATAATAATGQDQPGRKLLPGSRRPHFQPSMGVRRPEVLHFRAPAHRVHDLHRRRARGGLHAAHVGATDRNLVCRTDPRRRQSCTSHMCRRPEPRN
jgi:hypothetical protein